MPPRISVIVPIYNAASTLRAAVQSILTQNVAGLEVLLVDDGSTDATPGICHDMALRDYPEKFRYLRRPQPGTLGGGGPVCGLL